MAHKGKEVRGPVNLNDVVAKCIAVRPLGRDRTPLRAGHAARSGRGPSRQWSRIAACPLTVIFLPALYVAWFKVKEPQTQESVLALKIGA
jgi:hypothetical protein